MPKRRNKCDSVVKTAIEDCGCTKHASCPKKESRGHKPCEMKGSRIKSIIAAITNPKPGVDPVIILNQALEDNKEYFVCSTLARTIKKEEEALEKKKEEEEKKGKERKKKHPNHVAVCEPKVFRQNNFFCFLMLLRMTTKKKKKKNNYKTMNRQQRKAG